MKTGQFQPGNCPYVHLAFFSWTKQLVQNVFKQKKVGPLKSSNVASILFQCPRGISTHAFGAPHTIQPAEVSPHLMSPCETMEEVSPVDPDGPDPQVPARCGCLVGP